MNRTRALAVTILTAVMCVAAALPVRAGTKTIWADQFIPADAVSRAHFKMDPALATSDGGQIHLYCPIQLPVGATLDKMNFFFVGTDPTASLTVSLVRWKNGEVPVDTIISQTDGGVTVGNKDMTRAWLGDNIVRSNSRYEVRVTLSGSTVGIRNVSFSY